MFRFVFNALILALFIAFSSCRNNPLPSNSLNGAETSHANDAVGLLELVKGSREGINSVVKEIEREYPPDQYNYIFLGRSPTPLFAAMGLRRNAFSLPLSSGSQISQAFYLEGSCIFWLKKLFDHFDIYLNRLMLGIASNTLPRNIVVIDYISSASSLGPALQALDLYMRYQAKYLRQYSQLVDRNGLLPRLSYFALTHTDYPLNLDMMKDRIAAAKRPFAKGQNPLLSLKVVKRGEVNGAENLTVNVEEFANWINSVPDTGPWTGTVLPLTAAKYIGLLRAMQGQRFDAYSPYGAWYLYYSPLEAGMPALNDKFWQFRETLLAP